MKTLCLITSLINISFLWKITKYHKFGSACIKVLCVWYRNVYNIVSVIKGSWITWCNHHLAKHAVNTRINVSQKVIRMFNMTRVCQSLTPQTWWYWQWQAASATYFGTWQENMRILGNLVIVITQSHYRWWILIVTLRAPVWAHRARL